MQDTAASFLSSVDRPFDSQNTIVGEKKTIYFEFLRFFQGKYNFLIYKMQVLHKSNVLS